MSKILRCMSKRSGSYIYVDAINFNEEESTLQSLPEINKAAEKPDQESSLGCLYLPPPRYQFFSQKLVHFGMVLHCTGVN